TNTGLSAADPGTPAPRATPPRAFSGGGAPPRNSAPPPGAKCTPPRNSASDHTSSRMCREFHTFLIL
ncbi:hypothetical protein GNI_000530, partial [Gregarina niphandrodes]